MTSSSSDAIAELAATVNRLLEGQQQQQQPSRPFLTGRGIPMRWPLFKHDHTEQYEEFIRQFDLCCRLEQRSDAEKCVAVESCLAGAALAIFQDNIADDVKTDWPLLEAALRVVFRPPEDSLFAGCGLGTIFQNKFGSVAEYGAAIRCAVRNSFPTVPETDRKKMMKLEFWRGLNKPTFDHITLTNPAASFDQMYAIAQTLEAGQALARRRSMHQQSSPLSPDAIPTYEPPVYAGYALSVSNDRSANHVPHSQGRVSRGNRFHSRFANHNSHYSTNNSHHTLNGSPGPLYSSGSSGYQWTPQGDPICYICNQHGHIRLQCPSNRGSSTYGSYHDNQQSYASFRGQRGTSSSSGSRGPAHVASLYADYTDTTDGMQPEAPSSQLTPATSLSSLEQENALLREQVQENDLLREQVHRYQQREAATFVGCLGLTTDQTTDGAQASTSSPPQV